MFYLCSIDICFTLYYFIYFFFFFFFQAEDGIRDADVTGVQTCALPISNPFEEQFFVEDYEQVIEEIKFFDNVGRIIKTISETNTIQEIQTNFASGVYFINIETKDGRIMNKKMIKQ